MTLAITLLCLKNIAPEKAILALCLLLGSLVWRLAALVHTGQAFMASPLILRFSSCSNRDVHPALLGSLWCLAMSVNDKGVHDPPPPSHPRQFSSSVQVLNLSRCRTEDHTSVLLLCCKISPSTFLHSHSFSIYVLCFAFLP